MAASRIFWALLLIALSIMFWRIASGQADPRRLGQDREYAFEMDIEIDDSVGPFHLEIAIPNQEHGLRLQDEQIQAGDLAIQVSDAEGGRFLTVSGDRADLPAIVRYTVRISTRPLRFDLEDNLAWDQLARPGNLESTDLIQAGHPEVVTAIAGLTTEALAETSTMPTTPPGWQRLMRAAGLGPVEVVDRIYEYNLSRLRPADFSGQTDAITALRLGEASCGGKSRLMVAMLRTVGLNSRLVGGLIMGRSDRSRTSHVWVEVKLGDQWVPYDPLNDYGAELPPSFLPLYVGDLPLIVHERGLAFDYGFRAPLDRVPAVWALEGDEATLASDLPILRREQFSLILLAPFALLLVVFLRQVVGEASIGVFLPVLLGFCVTQVGWAISAGLLALTMLLGIIVRLFLARMSMLQVPRAALLITFLVLLFLMATILLESLNIHASRGLLVLPLAALAMAVERVTVVALDQGARAASWLFAQTLFLSALSALILMQPFFKVLTVTFPEILLLVLAEIIVIGQYRGLRLTERFRFRSVLREETP